MTITIEQKPLDWLVKHPEFQTWVSEYGEECRAEGIGNPGFYPEKYADADKTGQLRILAALDGARLAGAAALRVTEAAHYDAPLVSTDAIYLRHPWRKGGTGLRLLRAMRDLAGKEGAHGLVFMAPPGSSLDKLCERLGATNTHKMYWWNA